MFGRPTHQNIFFLLNIEYVHKCNCSRNPTQLDYRAMTCCSFIANHSLQFNSTCIFSTMIEVLVLFICNRQNGFFYSTLKMDFPPSSGLISCVDLIKLLWWTQIFKLLVEAEQWTKPLTILKSHKRCRLQESTSTMSELWKKREFYCNNNNNNFLSLMSVRNPRRPQAEVS